MKFKKFTAGMLACCFLFSSAAAAGAADPEGIHETSSTMQTAPSVTLSDHHVKLDGTSVSPEAYCINGENYFKLRDVAALLNGTRTQFNVSWAKETNAIELSTKTAYKAVGGELQASGDSKVQSVTPSSSPLTLNGESLTLTGYFINDGANYYRLRDIGDKIGFTVSWDNDSRSVLLESGGAAETPQEPTPETPSVPTRIDGKLTILVDAGHGGTDKGAGSADGSIYERELNLEVAQYLQEMLEQAGATVYMMREDNITTMSANARKEVIERYAPELDLCMSVHHNAFQGESQGSEILAQIQYEKGGAGQTLAKAIEAQYAAMGRTVRPTYYRKGTQGDYYYMLRYPADVGVLALISEFCFLDNAQDVAWVATKEKRYAEAQAIYNGIMDYFAQNEY